MSGPSGWLKPRLARTGVAGTTLIVTLAGSPGAVRDGIEALAPVVGHAVEQLQGADH